jgi:hypothetical protein
MGRDKLPPHSDPKINRRRERSVQRYIKKKELDKQIKQREIWRIQKQKWKQKQRQRAITTNSIAIQTTIDDETASDTTMSSICTASLLVQSADEEPSTVNI